MKALNLLAHHSLKLLDTLNAERAKAEAGDLHKPNEMLLLDADGSIKWVEDEWYESLMEKEAALRGR